MRAVSQSGVGLRATTDSGTSAIDCSASQDGFGVFGASDTGHGVHGQSRTNHAVHGESSAGRGVVGISQTFVGVTGQSASGDAVLGISETGVGVHGKGGQLAGFFEGDVTITGKLNHGGFDALQQISALKEQLSNVQNEASGALDLIKGLANFDGTLQGRIAILEQQVFGLQQDVAALQANSKS